VKTGKLKSIDDGHPGNSKRLTIFDVEFESET
jgi:hypothetical protein